MNVILLSSHWAELGLTVSPLPPPISVQSLYRVMGKEGGH